MHQWLITLLPRVEMKSKQIQGDFKQMRDNFYLILFSFLLFKEIKTQ